MTDAWYQDYIDFVATCDLDTFKHDPRYTFMLEHVSPSDGQAYFSLLTSECGMSVQDIESFCRLNDRIGSPRIAQIEGLSMPVSPTSLRYLYHASLILAHAPQDSHLVEIGCGYGGLCLAIQFLSGIVGKKVASYSCIDLDPAIDLQKRYLSQFILDFGVSFHSASTYGSEVEGKDLFLISNYCFSEIADHHQRGYIHTLFPRVKHGFLAWNHIPLYDIGKPLQRIERERPLTGSSYGVQNMFVYF